MKNVLARTLLILCLLCFAQGAEAYTTTTNYTFQLPQINNAIDQNQWGTELNSNFTSLDGLLLTASNNTTIAASGNTAMDSTYRNKLILADATGGAFNITLPAPATVASGFKFYVKKKDSTANAVTILPNAAETIDGASSLVIPAQYTGVELITDGTNWWSAIPAPTAKSWSVVRQVFTGNGTYTPTAGMVYADVEEVGGGAGGGGTNASNSAGGGGGAGGYAKKLFNSATIGASQAVTIGAAGAAGAIGGNGGNGGNTTLGALLTANGGTGGTAGVGVGDFAGGAGGTASLGDENTQGQSGGGGAGDSALAIGGSGGSAGKWGSGAPINPHVSVPGPGVVGTGKGSGGSGGAFSSQVGGAGTSGEVVVIEYVYH